MLFSLYTNIVTTQEFTFTQPYDPISQLDKFVEAKTKLKNSIEEWYKNLDKKTRLQRLVEEWLKYPHLYQDTDLIYAVLSISVCLQKCNKCRLCIYNKFK